MNCKTRQRHSGTDIQVIGAGENQLNKYNVPYAMYKLVSS